MADQWFYIADGVQKGPVDDTRLAELARSGGLTRAMLLWKAGLAGWKPASEVNPGLFPVEHWYYLVNGVQTGPVDASALPGLVQSGTITAGTAIWKEGMAQWVPAGQVPGMMPAPPPVPQK